MNGIQYVNIEDVEWCEKSSERWRNECCIIVFSIPISRPIKQKNKFFNTSNAEWQKNVKESRQCKKYTVQSCSYCIFPCKKSIGMQVDNCRQIYDTRNCCMFYNGVAAMKVQSISFILYRYGSFLV